MPFTSNKFGRNATYRTTANVTLAITDFSISYDGNQTGTVQIQGSNLIGTSTTFTTAFANGDFVYAVVNSSLSEARVINQVVNTTFLNVTATFTAANSATTYTKSETIDFIDIPGVTFTSNGSWTIARGSNTVLVLHGTDKFNFAHDGQSITDDHTGSVVITHSAAATGTLVVEFSKKSRTSNNLNQV